jgi:hypothetical protein
MEKPTLKRLILIISLPLFLLLAMGRTGAQEANPLYGFVDPESLQVISANFSADPYSKANYDPFIKVRVYNDSPFEVVRAFIRFTISCDNGKRRVFSEVFERVVSGGMPAYSTQTWLFYPRNASFWAMHNIPYDAKINAVVEKVFCPKKNSPWQYEHEFSYPTRHDMYY